MKLSLVVLTPGKMQGQALEIKLAQFLVGRDPQCHLRPASALISKRHCAVVQREGKVFVRDFDSTNGTFVNDVPVKGEVELHHDDKLKIGPLLFGVKIEVPTVDKPTPPPPTRPAARPAAKPAAQAADGPTPAPAGGAAKPAGAAAPAPEPAPEPAPKPAAAAAGEDEDIAAMLLSLQDDGSGGGGGVAGEVPEGSTVHDLTVSPDMLGGEANKDKKDLEAKAKAAAANTSHAAKAILEKYMRRPRNSPQG
jgi:predicted component of type VI protein secretion system